MLAACIWDSLTHTCQHTIASKRRVYRPLPLWMERMSQKPLF